MCVCVCVCVCVYSRGASVLFRVMIPLMGFHSHTQTHHIQQDSSGRVISTSQRPLPDNTQHQQTSMPPAEFELTIPAIERPQSHIA